MEFQIPCKEIFAFNKGYNPRHVLPLLGHCGLRGLDNILDLAFEMSLMFE